MVNKVIIELDVINIEKSKEFYNEVLGFDMVVEEEDTVILDYEGHQIVLVSENYDEDMEKLEYPYGRGVTFSFLVTNIEKIYKKVQEIEEPILMELSEDNYEETIEKSFLIMDPSGYQLRFIEMI